MLYNNNILSKVIITLMSLFLVFGAHASNTKMGEAVANASAYGHLPSLQGEIYPITDDMRALMLLMRVDSCRLTDKYFLSGYIDEGDLAEIKKWQSENNDILDKELIEDAKVVSQMYYKTDNMHAYAEFSNKLFERIRWRRSHAGDKADNNEFYNQFVDQWIKSLNREFVNSGIAESIYLSLNAAYVIEMINYLNGDKFVKCDEWILTRGDLYKLVDWWWANKGNVPEEVYKSFFDKLSSECLFDITYTDKQQDRRIISEILQKPEFEEYRCYKIIKME